MLLTSGIVPNTATESDNPHASSFILSQATSGQFLAMKSGDRGGIILQKSFYADFVGFGAAIGCSFDSHCTAIYPIGNVELYVPETPVERQQAMQQRIVYSQKLADIAAIRSPMQRAYSIVNQLCEWIGTQKTKTIPQSLIGQLAGVSSEQVKLAWERHLQECQIFAYLPKTISTFR